MLLSKNAIGNLLNRYKAVLKKCHLLNTFGSLAMVGALALFTTGGLVANVSDAYANSPAESLIQTITAQKSTITDPNAVGYYKEIILMVGAPAEGTYTFKIDSTNSSGAPITLYFAVLDNEGNLVKTNRVEGQSQDYTQNFIGNTADDGDGGGGMYNSASNGAVLEIPTITGDFVGNTATPLSGVSVVSGGGMESYASTDGQIIIGTFTGDFVGNTAQLNGGGMSNESYQSGAITIDTMISDFVGNTASYGGGMANYNTNSNVVSNINIGLILGSFIDNTATNANSGGGIYNGNKSSIGIGAISGLSLFEGNTAQGISNAIYNEGTVYLNAEITNTSAGILDIRDDITGTGDLAFLQINADRSSYGIGNNGLVMLDTVSGNSLTLHAGSLSFADGVAEEEFTKDNNSRGSFTTEAGSVLYLDLDLQNRKSDYIEAAGGELKAGSTVAFRMMSNASSTGVGQSIGSIGLLKNATYADAYTNDYRYSNSGSNFQQGALSGSNGLIDAIEDNNIRTFSLTGNLPTGSTSTFDDDGTLTIFGNLKDALADTVEHKYGDSVYILSSNPINVANSDAKLNIIDMAISDTGTAIHNTSGSVIIYNSSFSSNATAINNADKTYIFNSSFKENTGTAIKHTGNTLQLTNVNFKDNRNTINAGAIDSTQDLTFQSQVGDYIISGNHTTDGGNVYNAIYFAAADKDLNFELGARSSYTLNDSVDVIPEGSSKHNLNISGKGTLYLNNSLENVNTANIEGATLKLGSTTHESKSYFGSIIAEAFNIGAGADVIVQSNSSIETQSLTVDKEGTVALTGGILSAPLADFGTVDLNAEQGSQFSTENANVEGKFTTTTSSTLILEGGGGVVSFSVRDSLAQEIATDIFGDSSLDYVVDLPNYKTPGIATLDDVKNIANFPTETIGPGTLSYQGSTVFAAIRENDLSFINGNGVNLTLTGQNNNTTLATGDMTILNGASLTLGVAESPTNNVELYYNGNIDVQNSDLTVAHVNIVMNAYTVDLNNNSSLVLKNDAILVVDDVENTSGNAKIAIGLVGDADSESLLYFAGDKTFSSASDLVAEETDGKYAVGSYGRIYVERTVTFNAGGDIAMAKNASLTATGLNFVAPATLKGGNIVLVNDYTNAQSLKGALTVDDADSTIDFESGDWTTDSPLTVTNGTLAISTTGTLNAGADIYLGAGGTLKVNFTDGLNIEGEKLTANLEDFAKVNLSANGYEFDSVDTTNATVNGYIIADGSTELVLNATGMVWLDNYDDMLTTLANSIFGVGHSFNVLNFTINGYGQYQTLSSIKTATSAPTAQVAAGNYTFSGESTFAGIAEDERHKIKDSTINDRGAVLNLTGKNGTDLNTGTITIMEGKLYLGYDGTAATQDAKMSGGIILDGLDADLKVHTNVIANALNLKEGNLDVAQDKTLSINTATLAGNVSTGFGTLKASNIINTKDVSFNFGNIELGETDGVKDASWVTGANVNIVNTVLNISSGKMDASDHKFTVHNDATLKSAKDTELVVGTLTIGADSAGVITAGTATVNPMANDELLGNVTITGFDATMDYSSSATSDYGLLRTAGQNAFGTNSSINFIGITLDVSTATLDDVIDINDNTLGGYTIKMGTKTEIPTGKNIVVGAISEGDGKSLTLKNGSSLNITGNTAKENDGKLYGGTIIVETGANAGFGTGSLAGLENTGGAVKISGTTKVDEFTQTGGTTKIEAGSKLEVVNFTGSGGYMSMGENIAGGKGDFVATGTSSINNLTMTLDPAWSGVAATDIIENASSGVITKFKAGVDGHLIAGQNSYVVLGDVDTAWAQESFKNSGLTWGESKISSALFINNPQSLANIGSISVDGLITANAASEPIKAGTAYATTANTTSFTNNSLLVVNAANMGKDAALTATGGVLKVEDKATLVISDGTAGDTVTIVDGFSGASTVDGWGEGETLDKGQSETLMTDSLAVGIGSADWDSASGSFSVDLIALQVKLAGVNQSVNDFLTEAGNAKLTGTRGQWVDYVTDIKTDPKDAGATAQGTPQASTVAAVAASGFDVGNVTSNAIWARNNTTGLNSSGQEIAAVNLENGPAGDVGLSAGNAMQNGVGIWLMPLYEWKSAQGYESDGFDSGYNTGLGGIAVGADYTFNDMFRLGLAFNIGAGYTQSNGDFNDSTNSFDFWGLSLYAAYRYENFGLSADIGYNGIHNQVNQDMPTAAGLSSNSADVSSEVWTVGLNAEYVFNTSFMDITPHAGVRYMNVKTNAHDIENGGTALFEVEQSNQSVWYFPVGVTLSKDIVTESGWTFTPKVDLGFIAAAGDFNAKTKASMPGVATNIDVEMQNVDGFAFNGGVGFDIANADNGLSLGLNYNLQASEHETGHMIFATFRYDF